MTRDSTSATSLSASFGSRRWFWLVCFMLVAGLLGYAYYAQFQLYLDPCPLCITQRAFYAGIGIAAIIGFSSIGRRSLQILAAGLMSVAALGGMLTASRQVWLQHLPPEEVPECGPGLQYWLDNMPLLETISLLFKGDGNCAEVHWRFLGFSMGEWSLAWFVVFFLAALLVLVKAIANSGVAGEPTIVQ